MGSISGSTQGIVDQQKLVLDTALAYLAAGIVPVVVTHPSESHVAAGKAPRQPGWQRVAPSPAIVRSWFSKPSNLGVLCGRRSGFVCVDVDPRNGGMAWLIDNDHRFGYHLRENTGSGGYHLYYRYPQGVDHVPSLTGQDGLAPGVELKADGGHQVVTWPSEHPSGGEYEFAHGLSLLDLEAEADELPAWILDAALARHTASTPIEMSQRAEIGFTDSEQDLERAKGALEKWVGSVAEGGRNHAAYKVGWIGKLHGLSPKVWWPVALDWNSGCQPPLDVAELRHAVASGYKYTKSKTGENSVIADFPDDVEEPATLDAAEAEAQAEELGVTKYRHTNPVTSSRKFLRAVEGYFFSDERDHLYEDDTWKIVPLSVLRSQIWHAIVSANPEVNLKPKHVRDIVDTLRCAELRRGLQYDTWADQRPGDYVRVQNGIVDLNRIELLPHSRNWLSCTKLPFVYDPDARCPAFETFLQSIWGKIPIQIDHLQLWLGYMLSSRTDQQAFALLLGESRGGKGTLLKIMTALMGDGNYMSTDINSFGIRFGLADAIGKKLIVLPDAHKGSSEASDYAAERIKLITGEDPIVVEQKNENPQTIRLRSKIVIAANDMPKLVEIRSSLKNRMYPFRFTESFAGKEDLTLESRLMAELPGIFNWGIQGLEKLRQIGRLPLSDYAKSILTEIEENLNPTDTFISKFIDFVPNEDGGASCCLYLDFAYQTYRKWTDLEGRKPIGRSRFSAAVNSFFSTKPEVRREQTTNGKGRGARMVYFTNLRMDCGPNDLLSGDFVADIDPEDDDFI